MGRAQNFLEKDHVDRIYDWYRTGKDVENHVKFASMDEIAENDHNLNIPLYVEKVIVWVRTRAVAWTPSPLDPLIAPCHN